MLKGAQKKMIVVRTRDSRLFEEAYFVMRKDGGPPADNSLDIMAEANRIIDGSAYPLTYPTKPQQRPNHWRCMLWFAAGALCGGGLVGLLCLLL